MTGTPNPPKVKIKTYKKMDNKQKESESKIQQDCFVWFWNTFPELRRTLFHIPNGGYRGRVAGNRMKSIGVVAGIPDLCFVHKQRAYFFELKNETGVVRGKQSEIIFIFAKQGIDVFIIRTVDEFKTQINEIINR